MCSINSLAGSSVWEAGRTLCLEREYLGGGRKEGREEPSKLLWRILPALLEVGRVQRIKEQFQQSQVSAPGWNLTLAPRCSSFLIRLGLAGGAGFQSWNSLAHGAGQGMEEKVRVRSCTCMCMSAYRHVGRREIRKGTRFWLGFCFFLSFSCP